MSRFSCSPQGQDFLTASDGGNHQATHPETGSRCADGTVRNACGTCDPGCLDIGKESFPIAPGTADTSSSYTGVRLFDGLKLDEQGDLTVGASRNFDFMWIANTDDVPIAGAPGTGRGTISKIDTQTIREVARYFTVTCSTRQGDRCLDVNGKPIQRVFQHRPSRTAVDVNFDVWVANRAVRPPEVQGQPWYKGQPSVTRIANESNECKDRNANGRIETSGDRDGNGRIEVDCDGNGQADKLGTRCTKVGLVDREPEFYGDDDECVLFTVNYADVGDFGRSVCIGPAALGKAASEVWVGTNQRKVERRLPDAFYRIGATGKVEGPFALPEGHKSYGCVVDVQHVLWSVDGDGTLAYFDTREPANSENKGLITPPVGMLYRFNGEAARHFYGISLDPDDTIWLGAWASGRIWRYRPNRGSAATLGQGSWAAVAEPQQLRVPWDQQADGRLDGYTGSRGIAADVRGRVWVAFHGGWIGRIDRESLKDGRVISWEEAGGQHWPMNARGAGREGVGVGVDNEGHIWGIDYRSNLVSRLDVDDKGDPIETKSTLTDPRHQLPVGLHPYTYSDFTGYGLKNFTIPVGRYQYQVQPCPEEDSLTEWSALSWSATTPPGTSLQVRVRSGETEATLGEWVGPVSGSPADLTQQPKFMNPAPVLRLEFVFKSSDDGGNVPVLHDFAVGYTCKQRLY